MKTKQSLFTLLFFALVLFSSCRFTMKDLQHDAGEVSISVVRFDQLLNEYVEFNSFSALQKMNTLYPAESKLLIEDILELGQVSDADINERLRTYFSDSTLKVLMRDALLKFDDMSHLEKQFTKGFRWLKDEVPDIKVPMVYAQISALNGSVVVGDSLLGFSIDKYMGEDYPIYKRFYYDYQRKSMSPERIVPDCFLFFLMSEYPFPEDRSLTLINAIIHYGKINYVVSRILEDASEAWALGFTDEEMKWCHANERSIWRYILDNRHLNATDPMIIRKYTKPVPFTSFFGSDSPAFVGVWVGMQIVDTYMKRNKKVTIKELLDYTDYGQLLIDSKYNP